MRKTMYKNRVAMIMAYMGSTPLLLLISGYLVFFYTNIVGIAPGVLGVILLTSRILDGVSDVLFGNMIDRTRSKIGVCRPWLLAMAVGSIAAIISLLCVPNGGMFQYIYIFLSYNFSNTIVATISQLSAVSLPTYITRDTVERSRLYIWANTGQMITQSVVSGVMFSVITLLGGDRRAWMIVFVGIGIAGSVLTAVSVLLSREEVNPDKIMKKTGGKTRPTFWKSLVSCGQNKYWWMMLAVVICGTAVNVSTMTMTPYYSQYILGDITRADMLNVFYSVPMVIVVPVTAFFLEKTGKRNIALTGGVLIAAGAGISAVIHTSLIMLSLSAVLKSSGVGLVTAVSAAMIADTIEYGQWKTGIRNQAVLIGAQSAGTKIGQGVISAVLSWAIAIAGFDAGKIVQSESAVNCIIFLYGILPVGMAITIILILLRYDLDKRFQSIISNLEKENNVTDNNYK